MTTREQLVEKCKRLMLEYGSRCSARMGDAAIRAVAGELRAAIEELAASLPDEVERLRTALLDCARQAEALKQDCGMDPESAQAMRNARYQNISTTAHIALGTIRGPALAASLPSGVPEGWKLVPVEITEAMHAAAVRTIVRCTGNDDFPPRVYRAMLAASPAAPQGVQAGWIGFDVEISAAPRGVQVEPQEPKDHEIRELVNSLTKVAREHQGTQQLRERIAGLVVPFARGVATNKGDAVKAAVPPPPPPLGGFDLLIDGEAGKTLLGHLAPDLSPSEYGPACPVVLSYCNGHSGPGLYASDPAYPDEGSVLIITAPVYTQEELDAAKARSIETAAAIEAACADDGDPLPPPSPPAVQPESAVSPDVQELVEAAAGAVTNMENARRLLRAAGLTMEGGTISEPYGEALEALRAALSKYGSKQ